jgi:xylulose-5-phosphate/fructose-6-phosphate phosphoketolase
LTFDVVRRVPRLASRLPEASEEYWRVMERHKLYVCEHGEDMPEVADWRWPG